MAQPTSDQLLEALESAHNAGDTDAATEFAVWHQELYPGGEAEHAKEKLAKVEPSNTEATETLGDRIEREATSAEGKELIAKGEERTRGVTTFGAGAALGTLGMSEAEFRTPEAIGRAAGAVSEGIEALGLPRWLNPVRAIEGAADYVAHGQIPGTNIRTGGSSDIADRISDTSSELTKSGAFKRIVEKSQDADAAFDHAMETGDMSGVFQTMSDPEAWAGFIGQAAPSLVSAYLSGGSLPFIAWLESMEVASDAADFERRTGEQVSDADFTQAAGQVALVNTFLEKFGLDQILKATKGNILSSMLKKGVAEFGTEWGQNFNTNLAAFLNYNKEQSLTEGGMASGMGGFGAGAAGGAAVAVSERADQGRKPMSELLSEKLQERGARPEVAAQAAGYFAQKEPVMPKGADADPWAPAVAQSQILETEKQAIESVISEKSVEIDIAEDVKRDADPEIKKLLSEEVGGENVPIIFYHGSPNMDVDPIKKFGSNRYGIYLSKNRSVSEQYGPVGEYYIDSKNPIDFTSGNLELVDDIEIDVIKAGFDKYEIVDSSGDNVPLSEIVEYGDWSGGGGLQDAFLRAVKKRGFDSVTMNDFHGGGENETATVVFNTDQIVSPNGEKPAKGEQIEKQIKAEEAPKEAERAEKAPATERPTKKEHIKAVRGDIQSNVRKVYPGVDVSLIEKDNTIELTKIIVPAKWREKGLGTKVVQSIIEQADKSRKTITLTPSNDFGGTKARLVKFYKSLGFVENKGKNRDYEIADSMYLEPAEPKKKPDRPATQAGAEKTEKVVEKKVPRETKIEQQKEEGDYEYLASSSGRVGDNYRPMMDESGFPAKEIGSKFSIGGGKYVVIGKKPVTTKKTRDAVGKISKALLYYGKSIKVRGKTKGIYSVNGEFIQTAEKNTSQAVEVLAHELYHYLDEKKIYGDDLRKFSEDAAGGYTYNVNAPKQEGGAEFFRVYMTDYPTLRTAAPNEVLQLEALLKTKLNLYKRIKAAQKAMHEHLHQPVELRGDAYIGKEPGFAGRFVLAGGIKSLFQAGLDYRKGARDAAKGVDNKEAIMDLVNLPHHVYSFVTEAINSGAPRFEGGQIVFDDKRTGGFAGAVDNLSRQQRKRLWNYIDARRALTLKEEGREKLFSVDVIKKFIGFGHDRKIKTVAAHYDRLMKGMLNFVVENGGLRKDVAEKFGENYVNFGRVIERFSPTEESSGSAFMRLRGGSQLLQDPEQRVLKSITGMMRAGIVGRIKRELYSKPNAEYFAPWDKQFRKEDLNFGMVSDMLGELHGQGVVLFDKSFHEESGHLDMGKVEEYLKENPDLLMSFFAAEPTSTEFDIDSWIDENGEQHFVAMPKGGLFSVSMANLGKMNRTALGRFFAPIKAFYSHFLIMAAPYIQIPNMAADYLNFPLYTREYNGLGFFRSWADVAWMGLRAAVNTKSIQRYSKMGIFDTTANSRLYDLLSLPPTMHVRNKGPINEFFDMIGLPKKWRIENTGTLNANRLLMRLNVATKMLEYERAIKNGKTKQEAAYSANLMVAEWQMRGSSLWANTFFDLVPFARAYANPITREITRATEDPKHIGKQTIKRTTAALIAWNIRGGMTLGVLGIAAYLYMLADDERKRLWDESTPAQRMRSVYFLLTGDTDYTVMQGRLKIPFLYGSYFMGLSWAIMDEWRKVPEREPMSEFSLRLARNFVPPSGVIGLDNIFYLTANINPITWGPIEPEWMKKLPMEYRRGAYTPEFFNSNAESLLSPKQKEFMADRAAGAVGAMAVDITAAETWNKEQYGDRPFALYRPDDRLGGLARISTTRAFRSASSYRSTVYTKAFGEMLEKVTLSNAQITSALHDYKTRGNMELEEYIKSSAFRKADSELRRIAKSDLLMKTKWMNDDQRAAHGIALMKASFDVTRRIHYGNTKYYEGIAVDYRLISAALAKFKGKTIETSYGKISFPKNYHEYKKTAKDGATKEALIWAVQRQRNDHIKTLMQERKID